MVHALSEIRRVLVPDGILIDLRPMLDRWPIEVASSVGIRDAGRLQDLPVGLADDEAANRTIAQAAENGWFVREQEESFAFYYSWDLPSEMEDWIKAEWEGFIVIDEEVWNNIRSTWAVANADAQLRIRMKMLIARWRKL